MPGVETRLSPLIAGALAELAAQLRERYGATLLRVRLFGSAARGETHEGSDVDVCVVLEHADWKTRCAVIDLATDVELASDLTISPTIFDRERWRRFRDQERPLVMDIEREGIPL